MSFYFHKTLNILLFLTLSMTIYAQNASFFLSPNLGNASEKWRKGVSHRYELKKGKQIIRDEKQSVENESRQIVTLSINEATAKGFVISARYENTFNNPEVVEVRYAIGQNGDFQGIINMREVQQTFYHIFDNLTAVAASNPSVSRSVGEMRQFMTSDNYLTNSVFQEIVLIHQFYNNHFTIDSLERYETELPNLFDPSGTPFRAQATLLAKCEGDFAFIRHTVEPDLQVIKQQATHYLNRMNGSSPSKLSTHSQPVPPLSEAIANEYIFDEDFCSFNVKTGWISAFQRKRTILDGDVKTVEFIFLKEID